MQFRKKPVIVDVDVWDNSQNAREFAEFKGWGITSEGKLLIHTLEGIMTASLGDYIIRGISGEYYPCKKDIFEKTYEKVEE